MASFEFIDLNYLSCESYYTNLVENIHWTHLLRNSSMDSWYAYMCCVHICCWWWYTLCAYMLLVIIYVMRIYVVGEFLVHAIVDEMLV